MIVETFKIRVSLVAEEREVILQIARGVGRATLQTRLKKYNGK